MSLDNLKLNTKLLIPALFSALVIICTALTASWRLSNVTTQASDVIHRHRLTMDLVRAMRRLSQAENDALISLTADASSPVGKLASADFEPSLTRAVQFLDDAANAMPAYHDRILGFRDRAKAIGAKMRAAYMAGRDAPRLNAGEALTPDDLHRLAVSAGVLNSVSTELETLVGETVTFYTVLLKDSEALAEGMQGASQSAFMQIIVGGLLSALLAGALAYWISTAKVSVPLRKMAQAMRRLASGEDDVSVPGAGRGDEIGEMAGALLVFKEQAAAKARLEQTAADANRTANVERTRAEALKADEARKIADVMTQLAGALDKLANGKLTYRLTSAFPPEYERLRTDFNDAVGKLQTTIEAVAANTLAIRSGTLEISTAADDLSRRTEQQAANLEETAAAISNIVDTVRKTASGATHARDLVRSAREEAKSTGDVVQRAVDAMGDISASSSKVTQIIAVIDEIAFQTNLLALNAGVEAARAGDAGKGFAVVASEVRALAQRSAEAAKEIKSLIHASSAQVEQGVELVGETGAALGKIMSSIADINAIVQEIATSANEQSSSLDEVNTAIRQMDQVTQQNAAMVEESTAASKNLASDSEELARLVSEFEVGRIERANAKAAVRPTIVAAKVKPVPAQRTRFARAEAVAEADGWSEF
jgi:methyl-accepting chemotaxis protein